jgi:hypothetical protein
MIHQDWTEGYFSQIEYTCDFFPQLAPAHLDLVCLLSGQLPPATDRPFTYCELGSGHGLTTTVLAATNPDSRFIGDQLGVLAVSGIGNGVRAGLLERLVYHFLTLDNNAEPDHISGMIRRHSQVAERITSPEGDPLGGDAELRSHVARVLADVIPVWQRIGLPLALPTPRRCSEAHGRGHGPILRVGFAPAAALEAAPAQRNSAGAVVFRRHR